MLISSKNKKVGNEANVCSLHHSSDLGTRLEHVYSIVRTVRFSAISSQKDGKDLLPSKLLKETNQSGLVKVLLRRVGLSLLNFHSLRKLGRGVHPTPLPQLPER